MGAEADIRRPRRDSIAGPAEIRRWRITWRPWSTNGAGMVLDGQAPQASTRFLGVGRVVFFLAGFPFLRRPGLPCHPRVQIADRRRLSSAAASGQCLRNGPQGRSAGPWRLPDDRQRIHRVTDAVGLYGLPAASFAVQRDHVAGISRRYRLPQRGSKLSTDPIGPPIIRRQVFSCHGGTCPNSRHRRAGTAGDTAARTAILLSQ
jgi:hypothetical protein